MNIQKPLRIKENNSHRINPSPYLCIISIFPVYVNVYAKFDEIPFITLKDINETKCYRQMDRHTRTM